MKRIIPTIFILLLFLSACDSNPQVESTPTSTQPEPTLNSTSVPTSTPTSTIVPPTSTPTPTEVAIIPVTIAIESEWETQVFEALSAYAPEYLEWEILIDDDPANLLLGELADLCLCADGIGPVIFSEPIAFTVPFVSSIESITYQEALDIFDNGDYNIEVEPWSGMSSDRKALSISGVSPQDDGYLFNNEMNLTSVAGMEDVATLVANILHNNISFDPVVSLAAVGDVMLDKALGEYINNGYPNYPFEQVASYLQAADIAIGNFESAMTDVGAPREKMYVFNAPLDAVDSLTYAGFDMMTLANNHVLDYGEEAMLQGMEILNSNGIKIIGAGANADEAYAPEIVEMNGLKIAFLGYVDTAEELTGHDPFEGAATDENPGAAWATADNIYIGVNAIKEEVDVVVVVLHSGLEYCERPSPTQFNLAHTAISAGADIVIGHHAHTVQGVEFYQGGVIVYGLGNFAFQDDIITSGTCGSTVYSYRSVILNVFLDEDGVREIEFVPVVLDETGRPMPVYGEDADTILERLYLLTQYLN